MRVSCTGLFTTGTSEASVNREQRRAQPKQPLILTKITLSFQDQEDVNLDIHKVLIVDKITKKPLFQEKKQ